MRHAWILKASLCLLSKCFESSVFLQEPQEGHSWSNPLPTGQTLKYYSSELSKNLEQEDITCLNNGMALCRGVAA